MKHESPALLPPGFQDLLPPESDRERYLIQTISDIYKSFGYRFVKPPLMEFESSFTASSMGQALSPQTFRLMDPMSHAMMVLRADITPQIVRLAKTRMPNSPRPLRLFYAADSLRVQAGQIRTARQFTQIGCECIGVQSIDVDVEVCLLSLLSLQALGVEDMTLDLALPSLVPSLLNAAQIDPSKMAMIKKSLSQKDVSALTDLDGNTQKIFTQMLGAVGPAGEGLEILSKIKGIPDHQVKRIHDLQALCEQLHDVIDIFGIKDVSLTIDPLETLGFDYHNSFGFTLFSKQIQGELGRGGRYKASFSSQYDEDNEADIEQACGFSLYTDNLRHLVANRGKPNRLAVPKSTSWLQIKSWQEEGWKIVRQLSDNYTPSELKNMGCTHMIKNDDIEKL